LRGDGGGAAIPRQGAPLSVAVVLRTLVPEGGGPVVSVPRLWREVARTGDKVTVLLDETDENRDRGKALAPLRCAFLKAVGVRNADVWRDASATLIRCLGVGGSHSAVRVVSFHGMWELNYAVIGDDCRRMSVPYVIHPHGSLEPWARKYHRIRKRVAAGLWTRRFSDRAAMFRATSEGECKAIRSWGYKGPMALVTEAVDIPVPPSSGEIRDWREKMGVGASERIALFLSRIHSVKGVDLLLEEWKRLGEKANGWRLVIAGPRSSDCPTYADDLLRNHGLTTQVIRKEGFWGRERDIAMAVADFFVLPSRSENFGLVVAEALAAGTPVITTEATPWVGLGDSGAGWCVTPTNNGIREALDQALQCPSAVLTEMGSRGRTWMAEEFSWPAAGRRFREVLEYMGGVRDRPQQVVPEVPMEDGGRAQDADHDRRL
jgi:glycosyltransferase involved in cell wall biosynthesis